MFLRRLLLSLLAAALFVTALRGAAEIPSVVTVSAASFEATGVAPDAIAATFGSLLSPATASGGDTDPLTPGVQLPTQLMGVRVDINGRAARLLFVSPGQINFVVPPQTETGPANVVVFNGDSSVANGTVAASPVNSGIFTANSDGHGVAAALAFRVRADLSTQYEPVAVLDPTTNRYIASPIDLGPVGERVFLVIFATGLRHASDPNGDGNLNETVRVLLGGEELVPGFVGSQGDFVGLDQINVELPRSLIGRGEISFGIAIPGAAASNQAEIAIAGPSGGVGPLVSGFTVSPALAGQTLTITGSGFSVDPNSNVVRINGIEAAVTGATPTELIIVVPFGVQSGNVSVRTLMGEGSSGGPLLVRTSISGFVENTVRQPLSGVLVKLVGSSISAQTTAEGSFVLPDVPTGTQYVEIDGESLPTNPPYPKITLKTIAFANRDNQFARPVSLQQSNGGSGSIGAPGGFAPPEDSHANTNSLNATNQLQPAQPVPIQTGGFSLLIPANIVALFPGGGTSGTLFLTPLTDGRAPVDLPQGVFSSSIVQVTPFDVQLTPGAKLTFPNTDALPANALAKLYRYDTTQGAFVEDAAGATVSADGQRVETSATAIKKTSYFFVAVAGVTSTVTGRVLESDGLTPVRRALVSLRGQETTTDGNGGYLLRYVPVKNGETLVVEAAFQRPDGRIDRAKSVPVSAALNGITKIPDILMPTKTTNRPPVILGPLKFSMDENQVTTLSLIVSDPDLNQNPRVTLTGPAFASLLAGSPIGTSNVVAGPTLRYGLRLAPGFSDAGNYNIVVTALDEVGGRTTVEIALSVRNVNRVPVVTNQSVSLDEDLPAQINLAVTDADGDQLALRIVNNPLHGTVSGAGKTVTYSPSANYFGADVFTYKVNDGTVDSNTATVSLTVRAVNDAPLVVAPTEQVVREGHTLSFAVVASDVDPGQTLSFAGIDLPSGAKLETTAPTTAQFSWTPGFTQAGRYTFAVTVTDSGQPPLTVTRPISVSVFDTRHDFGVEASDLTILGADALAGAADATGSSVATGDVNGDGVADLIVGAPFARGSGPDNGRVYVFYGREALGGTIDLAIEGADVTIIGEADRDGFGASVATGDINGDGKVDLVIGAPQADSTERSDSGKVYVIFGAIARGSFRVDEKADLTVHGARAGDQLGWTVVAGRLRQQDGPADLVIAAPKADVQGSNGPLMDAGVVYVLFGGTGLGGARDLSSTVADMTLSGVVGEGELGGALAVGDYTGDKVGDLAIGAPLADLTFKDQGIVYLILGSDRLKGDGPVTQMAAMQYIGKDVGDTFGYALAFGDLNGDGRQDLLVGAPGGDGPTNLRPAAGEVSVFFGTDNTDVRPPGLILYGTGSDPGTLGVSLAAGDFTGDGIADLAMGAPSRGIADGPNAAFGAVYLIFGSRTMQGGLIDFAARTADLTVLGADAGDRLGLGGLAVGNVNDGAIADLIMGVPMADSAGNARQGAGEVRVLFGVKRE